MGAQSVTKWYGVCDRCGQVDDDSRPTKAEARDRMWVAADGRELCWDCFELAPPQPADNAQAGERDV